MTSAVKPTFPVVTALVLLIGATVFAVDGTVPALPDAAVFFGVPVSAVQATVSMFLLGYGLGQVPLGYVSDSFGRRPVALWGMAVFTLMGLLASATQSLDIMLLCRFLQGLAAASGAVVARAIVRDITEGAETARLMSLVTSTLGFIMLLAPTIGAVAVSVYDWRGPYFLSALLPAAAFLIVLLCVAETRPAPDPEMARQKLFAAMGTFFKTPQALFGTFVVAASFSSMMTFITLSSEVFMVGMGYSSFAFGLVFALASFGYVVGGYLSRHLKKSRSPFAVGRMFSLAFLVFGAGFSLFVLLGEGQFLPFVVLCTLCFSCVGALLGLGAAIVLAPLPHMAGSAAAMMGTLQLVFSASLSLWTSSLTAPGMTVIALGFTTAGIALATGFALFSKTR